MNVNKGGLGISMHKVGIRTLASSVILWPNSNFDKFRDKLYDVTTWHN